MGAPCATRLTSRRGPVIEPRRKGPVKARAAPCRRVRAGVVSAPMNAAKPPKAPQSAAEAAEARRARQAEALRANLRRRKAGGDGEPSRAPKDSPKPD